MEYPGFLHSKIKGVNKRQTRDPLITLSQRKSDLDPEQGATPKPRSKITMVLGFYAAMGGYVIRSHSLDKTYPITGQGRLTLTKSGVLYLLRVAPEVFPDLSEDEILDKTKASTLIKSLTCLQGLWFCLQCIVRLTMKTSISLLELNVFGHCICTFVIYAIWWNKPMDVSESTPLESGGSSERQALLALLCSYTTRTVPRLPPALAKCVYQGHEYRLRPTPLVSRTADSSVSQKLERSNPQGGNYQLRKYLRVQHRGPTRRDVKSPSYLMMLSTDFDTTGSPVLFSRY
jgi:hypothetical protein